MLEARSKNKGFVNFIFESISGIAIHLMKYIFSMFPCLPTELNWRLGVENGAERSPPPGIRAQHPAPAQHASRARHDRSMAR